MKPGIYFHVPAEDRDALLEWVRKTDQRIIRHQIEEYGRALVVVLHRPADGTPTGRHLAQIERVPDLGAAMPYVGPLGGGYELIFEPCPDGFRLTAHVPALLMRLADLSDGEPAGSLPYDLPLSLPFSRVIRAPILCEAEIAQLPGLGPELDRLSYNLTPPDGERPMIYGFGGTYFDRFHSWGEFRDHPESFSFHFRPYIEGCDIKVRSLCPQPELTIC